MEFIKNLADNFKIPDKPIEIDLVLEGGACNIGYLLGSLLLIKELEKRHYFKINRISGCSAGAIMALYFLNDKLEDWIKDYEKIRKHFINELNISVLEEVLGEKVLNMSNSLFKEIKKDKLFINYRDKNVCSITKSKYETKEELLDVVLKSVHIPFFINGEMYRGDCIDGGLPIIFNSRDEKDNPILYLSISNRYLWLKTLNIHRERNVYGRLLEGALQAHKFLLHKQKSYMCSYIHDWGIIEWTMVRLNQLFFYIFVNTLMNISKLLIKIYPYVNDYGIIKTTKEIGKEYIRDLVLLLLI